MIIENHSERRIIDAYSRSIAKREVVGRPELRLLNSQLHLLWLLNVPDETRIEWLDKALRKVRGYE